MSDALERAAKALWEVWPERHAWNEWEDRQEHFKEETRKEARAALLAFLDGEDAAVVNAMTGAANGGLPDSDYDDDVRAMLAALRALIDPSLSTKPSDGEAK